MNIHLPVIEEPLKSFYKEEGYNLYYGTYWQLGFDSKESSNYPKLYGYKLNGKIVHSKRLTGNYDIDILLQQLNKFYKSINRISITREDIPPYKEEHKDFINKVGNLLGKDNRFDISSFVKEVIDLTEYKRWTLLELKPCIRNAQFEGYGYLKSLGKLFPLEAAEIWNIPISTLEVYIANPLRYQLYFNSNHYEVDLKWPKYTKYGYVEEEDKVVEITDRSYKSIGEFTNKEQAVYVCSLLNRAYEEGWNRAYSEIESLISKSKVDLSS